MIEVIKHYYKFLKNKAWYNSSEVEFKGKNVYNMQDYAKEMTFVHRTLKLGVLVPAIKFLEWMFKGKLKVVVDDDYQFRKLKVFNESYEEALKKWNTLYRPHAYKTSLKPEQYMNDCATKNLRFIKDMYVTVNHSDTAYLEFHNFLMDEICKGMSKLDKNHVLYTNRSVVDNRYFIITKGLNSKSISLDQVK